ncbi:hypothetical protein D9M70_322450 [compost metagenome]
MIGGRAASTPFHTSSSISSFLRRGNLTSSESSGASTRAKASHVHYREAGWPDSHNRQRILASSKA